MLDLCGELPKRNAAIDRLSKPAKVVGGRVFRRIEVSPEILSKLLSMFLAGRAIAAAKERAEMGRNRVGFGMLVARAFVTQLVVDRRLTTWTLAVLTTPHCIDDIRRRDDRADLALNFAFVAMSSVMLPPVGFPLSPCSVKIV